MDNISLELAADSEDLLRHLAPNCSPEHLALRAAARKSNQNEQTLRDLLWLINAHDRLVGFGRIAENLLFILSQLEEFGSIESDQDPGAGGAFSGWPLLLRWITQRNKTLESLPPVTNQSREINPVIGRGVQRHPLYGCLWCRQNDDRVAERYALLQGHVLIAHARYLYGQSRYIPTIRRSEYEQYGKQEMWEAFPNSPEEAMRSVRFLSEPGWSRLLVNLPVYKRPEAFPSALSSFECRDDVNSDLRAKWPTHRENIQFFLEKVYGLRRWVDRESGQVSLTVSRNETSQRMFDDAPGDDDDPYDHWLKSQRFTISEPSGASTRDELLDLELDPEEIEEQHHWLLVSRDQSPPDLRKLAVDSALAARGQCRHVQLAHQLLPWQYSQLSIQELTHLLHQSSSAFRSLPKSDWKISEYRAAELVVLLHVILWTSSPIERAWNLKLLTGKEQDRNQSIRDAELLYDLLNHAWQIRCIGPPYKSTIPDPDDQAYKNAETLALPDSAQTFSFLERLLTTSHKGPATQGQASTESGLELDPSPVKSIRERAGYVFLDDLEYYRGALKQWLAAPAHNLTGRVTLNRIESFLFDRLSAASGDLMAAALITGRDHPQTRTQRFYAAYSEPELQKQYSEVTSSVVWKALIGTKRVSKPSPNYPLFNGGRFVGARLCMKFSAVQNSISTLKSALQECMSIRDAEEFERFHNLYTVWVVLWLGYATSMRAIRTPYIRIEEIDEPTGFTFLSDKDDDAGHKTRLAWIPPTVYMQIKAYSDHLSALASDDSEVCKWHEPCLFLEKGKPIEVRPKTLSPRMRPFWKLPPNSHRKFLRHELGSKGCPQEVTNAWLGHAFQGEEIWGPHSSLSYSEYRSNLEIYLLPILKELGWELVTSPIV